MRMDHSAFEAEVLRRSDAYRQNRSKRRKQYAAGLLAVFCCVGLGVTAHALLPDRISVRSTATHETVAANDAAIGEKSVLTTAAGETEIGAEQDKAANDGKDGAAADPVDGDYDWTAAQPNAAQKQVTVTAECDSYPRNAETVTFVFRNDSDEAVTTSSYASHLQMPNGGEVIFDWAITEAQWTESLVTVQPHETALITVDLTRYRPHISSAGTYTLIFDGGYAAEFTLVKEGN